MRAARNILHLGIKELRSLMRDPILLLLIAFALTLSIYSSAKAMPETLNRRRSPSSTRTLDALCAHRGRLLSALLPAAGVHHPGRDGQAHGRRLDTFALFIPADFERDLLAGHDPSSSSTSMPRA